MTRHDADEPAAPAPKRLERAEVERIADLAHLRLTDTEIDSMSVELGKILGFVEQMASLDLEGVDPTSHVEFEGAGGLRDDVVVPELSNDEALAEAPHREGGGFAVPGFVDEG